MTNCAPLLVVAGPTGSGKSGLAIELALRFDGEIVSCDSVQVYRHFEIGTAKVPLAERRGAPHHLVDVVEPDQPFTAGDYARLARAALADVSSRGKLPIVVGGTGFYLKALLEGLFDGPERDEEVRARLRGREQRRPGSLHRILRRLDRAAAARIHINDVQKLIRALEVVLVSQRPMSELFRATGRDPLIGYRTLKIGLNPPRALLYRRIEDRARQMFERGIVEETRRILAMGFDEAAKPFESLGYAQALAVMKRVIEVPEAISDTQKFTRRYAKRQWTWFRRDPEMIWLQGFGEDPDTLAAASELVRQFVTE